MGYFSNGSEGEAYQARWCERCQHWPDDPNEGSCAVWLAHLLHNGDEALHVIIPLTPDGLGNGRCGVFLQRPDKPTGGMTG